MFKTSSKHVTLPTVSIQDNKTALMANSGAIAIADEDDGPPPTQIQKRLMKHRAAHKTWLQERVADGNQRETRIVGKLLVRNLRRKCSVDCSPTAAAKYY